MGSTSDWETMSHAAEVLTAYLDVFTHHYLNARQQLPVDADDAPASGTALNTTCLARYG